MATYRIDCVHKPNRMSRHEHITDVGGPKPEGGRWQDKVENVVRFIENKQHRFYTQDGNSTAWVAVRKSPWDANSFRPTQMVSGLTICSPSTSARPSSTAADAHKRFLVNTRGAMQFSSPDPITKMILRRRQ